MDTEFEGTGGNPQEISDSAKSTSTTASASANTITIAEYLKQSLEKQTITSDNVVELKDVVKTSFKKILKHDKDINATTTKTSSFGDFFKNLGKSNGTGTVEEREENETALTANTAALLSLRDTIEQSEVSLKGENFDANFFTSFLSIVSSKKKINRIELFANKFSNAARIMGSAQKWVPGIEAVTSAMTAASEPIRNMAKSALIFSGGLALLGLTMITFMEAITFEDLFKFGLIVGAVAGISKLTKGAGWDLAKVTVGIATLGLSIWAFNELITSEEAANFTLNTLLVMGGVAAATKIASYSMKGKGFADIMKSTIAVGAIGGSVYLFAKAMGEAKTIDLMKAAELGVVIAGYGIGFKLLGSMAGSIVKGAVSAAAIGGGLWLLSKGLSDLSAIDLSMKRALELAAITTGAAAIFTLIGNPVTIGFTLAGAAGAAAIGGGLAILGFGINSLAKVNVSSEQAENFKNSALMISDTFAELANPLRLPLLVVGIAQSALIAGSTLVMSGALALVSKTSIAEPAKYEAFKNGAITLSDVFADFGGPVKLARVTMGAGIATLVAGATVATSLGIATMTRVISSPDKVTKATQSLDLFIGGVETALVGREAAFPAINKGINSFMGLSNMVGEVASSAQAMGNLQFVDKEVKNGKVVIKSVRSFTPEDFNRIGSSIGMMLSALTDPLAAIGGSKETYSIGGFTVTNPFSNKVQAGITAVAEIGNVFTPLAAILDVFGKNNIDEAYVQAFNKNIGFLMNGLTTNFVGLSEVDNESLDKLGIGTKHLSDLVNNISQEKTLQGVTNFEKIAGSVTVIKDSVNAMNLDKLSKLNDLVFNVNASMETDALESLVKNFTDFVEELSEKLGNIAGSVAPRERTSRNANEEISNKQKETSVGTTSIVEKSESRELDLSSLTDAIAEISTILRSEVIKVRNDEEI